MPYSPCTHKTAADFKVGSFWRCSACGTQGPWTEGWMYYGTVECRRCWEAAIEFVACSDTCAATFTVPRTPRATSTPKRPPRRVKQAVASVTLACGHVVAVTGGTIPQRMVCAECPPS